MCEEYNNHIKALRKPKRDEDLPNKALIDRDGIINKLGQKRRIRVRIDEDNLCWISVSGIGGWYGIFRWPDEVVILHEMLSEVINTISDASGGKGK